MAFPFCLLTLTIKPTHTTAFQVDQRLLPQLSKLHFNSLFMRVLPYTFASLIRTLRMKDTKGN